MVGRDNSLGNEVSRALLAPDYKVHLADDVLAGFSLAMSEKPDVIILLKESHSSEYINFCKWIRKESLLANIPIIVLGPTEEVEERIRILDAGANDYLSTPIEEKELKFRIEMLKRHDNRKNAPRTMNAGLIEMNLDSCVVTVSGEPVMLTTKEYRLLQEMLEAKGRVLSRDYLMERVWNTDKTLNIQTRTIDIHMSRLRSKLGPAGRYIITVRSIGYRVDIVPEWMS